MAWLDALRGIAALAVVADHVTQVTLTSVRPHIYHWFDLGNYGVFVFFMISGYIVPASLERKGSVRTFWVSRVFRLYPMYMVAIALAFLPWMAGLRALSGVKQDPANSVFAQLLMMGDGLAGPNLPNVVWSLTYEMAFYLLLTFLFIAGLHRRSWWYALGFGVAAVMFGGVLPKQVISGHAATPWLVSLTADALIVAGLAGAIVLRGKLRLAAAALAAGVALLLLTVNTHQNWVYPWEIPTILGLMFTGTTLYRAERGEYPWSRAIAVAAGTIGLAIAAGIWHSQVWGFRPSTILVWRERWFVTLVLAGLTFGVGLMFQHVRVPKVIAWLGLVSYSIYLLHPLLLQVLRNYVLNGHKYLLWQQALIVLGYTVVVVAVASVSYLIIERPAQQAGRRVARWLDARYGSDRRISRPPPKPEPHAESLDAQPVI